MPKAEKSEKNSISENLKKGITEMLILSFLDKEDMHTYAIINKLDELSGGVCKISYPYAVIYRLTDCKYIEEAGKKVDENRLRQFYRITPSGKAYLNDMRKEYDSFINGVNMIFQALKGEGTDD